MAKAKAARTTPMMSAAPKSSEETPAKAEIKKKKKKKFSKKERRKLKRYKVKTWSLHRDQVWIVAVIDREDDYAISIDNKWARILFKTWLKQHFEKFPLCTVGPWSFDQDNSPVEVVIQLK